MQPYKLTQTRTQTHTYKNSLHTHLPALPLSDMAELHEKRLGVVGIVLLQRAAAEFLQHFLEKECW